MSLFHSDIILLLKRFGRPRSLAYQLTNDLLNINSISHAIKYKEISLRTEEAKINYFLIRHFGCVTALRGNV